MPAGSRALDCRSRNCRLESDVSVGLQRERWPMSVKIFSLRQIRALRLIRAGSASDEVCRSLRLSVLELSRLEIACQGVPDGILARLEQLLSDNEKLRRLVAGLNNSAPAAEHSDS